MKKILALILTLTMIMTMMISTSMVNVSAATGDGVLDFDTGSMPQFTVTNPGTKNEMNIIEEDGYKIQGRKSHYAQE